MLQYHYDGREKIRNRTINKVKIERNKIIKEEKEMSNKNNKYRINNKNSKSFGKTEEEKRRIKMIENGKKSIELVKKRQRFNIECYVEDMINKDLMLKTNIAKEKKMKMIEEENLKEINRLKIEREKKATIQEEKRKEKINKEMEEQEIKRKEKEEKETLRKKELMEEEKKNQIMLKHKAELDNLKHQERLKGIEENNKKQEEKYKKKILEQEHYQE